MDNDIFNVKTAYPESLAWIKNRLKIEENTDEETLDRIINFNLQKTHDKIADALIDGDWDSLRNVYLDVKDENGEVSNPAWLWFLCAFNNNIEISSKEAHDASAALGNAMDKLIYRYNCIGRYEENKNKYIEQLNSIYLDYNIMSEGIWNFWFKIFFMPQLFLTILSLFWNNNFCTMLGLVGVLFLLIGMLSEKSIFKSKYSSKVAEYYESERNLFADDIAFKYNDLEVRAKHTYQAFIN